MNLPFHVQRFAISRALAVACLAMLAGCGEDIAASVAQSASAVAVPTNLTATAGSSIVNLTWSGSSAAAGYKVKRSTISGGPYTQISSVTTTSFADSSVSNGTAYMYVVSAFSSDGESADSAQATASPVAPTAAPAAPAGLAATSGNAQVALSWTASTGASSYIIKRSSTSGGPYTQVGTSTSSSYADTTVTNNMTFFYVVAAMNSVGGSVDSAQVSASPVAPAALVGVPAAPAGLSATAGTGYVTLSWSATSGATSYRVKRSTTTGGPYTQVASQSATSFTNSGLANGTRYYYVVSAANSGGEGANSAQVSSTPVAPAAASPTGTLPTVACSNLGTPGTWKQITPAGYDADYRVAAFVVDKNTGIVYLGTDSYKDGNSKGVQRSIDCGETWQHVSTGSGSDAVNGGRQWTFAINSTDGRVMYTNSGYYQGGLWKSYNGGFDWVDVTPKVDGAPGFVGYLSIDPEDPEHLFITWHDPCKGLNNEYKWEDLVGCFHETKDGGRTWKGHYSTGTKWPNEVRAVLLHGSTFLVLADSVLRTTDGGASYSSVNGGSLSGHSSGLLSRAADGTYLLGTADGVFRSTKASDGQQWTGVGGRWVGEIADAGTQLYATQMQGPLLSSAAGDGVNWSNAAGSPANCERIRYDALHKALYVSCGPGGLWRMITP